MRVAEVRCRTSRRARTTTTLINRRINCCPNSRIAGIPGTSNGRARSAHTSRIGSVCMTCTVTSGSGVTMSRTRRRGRRTGCLGAGAGARTRSPVRLHTVAGRRAGMAEWAYAWPAVPGRNEWSLAADLYETGSAATKSPDSRQEAGLLAKLQAVPNATGSLKKTHGHSIPNTIGTEATETLDGTRNVPATLCAARRQTLLPVPADDQHRVGAAARPGRYPIRR
jgi:hypothetical protein